MRFGVVAVLVFATSSARADVRWSAGGSYLYESFDFDDVSRYPGPSVAVDGWGKRGWGVRAALHTTFAAHVSTTNSTPCCEDRFNWLLELQALHMWHADQVHFALGGGLNLGGYRAYNVSDGGDGHGKASPALGLHATLGIDVARTQRGTFQIVGELGMYSLAQLVKLCDGEISCADQITIVSLGVGFSPR